MEEIHVGKHVLSSPVYNASGVHCVHINELDELLANRFSGAVLTKSATVMPRMGNRQPRYYSDDNMLLSLNSSGLPNLGMGQYVNWIEQVEIPHKPCILSIAPLSKADMRLQVETIASNSRIIDPEINLSCPNIVGKPQVAYDLDTFTEYLREIAEIMGEKTFGLKLPPYFDNQLFGNVADIVNSITTNSYLTCINSVPNGFMVDIDSKPVIEPNDGFGGLGGKCILPVALASVKKFSTLTNKDIVGCGGIVCGADVHKHMLCGAKAVQIGTTLYDNGISEFERIYTEYMDLNNKQH